MGKVIICASQKGGVGKTSTATALASIFAQRGYRTLIIDCDQQCNTTDSYRAETEGVATIVKYIDFDKFSAKSYDKIGLFKLII